MWTCDRGKDSALHKLMTTRFHFGVAVMELLAFLKEIHQDIRLGTVQTANPEADALAKREKKCYPELECVIDSRRLWDVR